MHCLPSCDTQMVKNKNCDVLWLNLQYYLHLEDNTSKYLSFNSLKFTRNSDFRWISSSFMHRLPNFIYQRSSIMSLRYGDWVIIDDYRREVGNLKYYSKKTLNCLKFKSLWISTSFIHYLSSFYTPMVNDNQGDVWWLDCHCYLSLDDGTLK